jgi:hypothetical protein
MQFVEEAEYNLALYQELFEGELSDPEDQVMVLCGPREDLFGDLLDNEGELCVPDPAMSSCFKDVNWQHPPFMDPKCGAQCMLSLYFLTSSDGFTVTCGLISPGRLAICHNTQRRKPYLLPFKAEGVLPFVPEPLRIQRLVYNQSYKDRQHVNNLTSLHGGRKHKRAGAKQRARNEAQVSGGITGSSKHSLFDGALWKARGELVVLIGFFYSYRIQLYNHFLKVPILLLTSRNEEIWDWQMQLWNVNSGYLH